MTVPILFILTDPKGNRYGVRLIQAKDTKFVGYPPEQVLACHSPLSCPARPDEVMGTYTPQTGIVFFPQFLFHPLQQAVDALNNLIYHKRSSRYYLEGWRLHFIHGTPMKTGDL